MFFAIPKQMTEAGSHKKGLVAVLAVDSGALHYSMLKLHASAAGHVIVAMCLSAACVRHISKRAVSWHAGADALPVCDDGDAQLPVHAESHGHDSTAGRGARGGHGRPAPNTAAAGRFAGAGVLRRPRRYFGRLLELCAGRMKAPPSL